MNVNSNILTKLSTSTTPTFSEPFAWHEQLEVTLEFLRDPAFAIRFALDHVDPGMVQDFMEDWQADKDAGETSRSLHWLEGMREDLGPSGAKVDDREEAIRPPEPDYSDMRAFSRSLAAWSRQRRASQQQ